ncbi:MAG TPA: acyclic terpene utilization AtuA family protein, partial [Nocardioidaceae bacterium]|nr:acyclic terpene utilization AtuA family protein [Nocardioidaceae bacterium]
DRRLPGYPIAEVAADGSTVITKHDGTGGLVSPGTVTAQLLYEIQSQAYANPDVVLHLDTIALSQEGPDRVLISGATGSPPPPDLKVAINYLGGYRNTMTLVITGLDIEEKAAWARRQLFELLGGENQFDEVDVLLQRFDQPNAPTNEQATAHLRITVKDQDPSKVGRRFANATMELFLGGYAGFHTTTPPTSESAYGVYWPALVPVDTVTHRVVLLPESTTTVVPHGPTAPLPAGLRSELPTAPPSGPTRRVPLGTLCAARSGDKGGNANIGLWTKDATSYRWLESYLTEDRFRDLLPEAAGLAVRRWALPNLNALNFVVVGLLGSGVAASARPDPQAKGLGEYLRSRDVDIPEVLLGEEA